MLVLGAMGSSGRKWAPLCFQELFIIFGSGLRRVKRILFGSVDGVAGVACMEF